MPEGFVMPLPKGFSWEQGAAVPETWITAYLELIMLGELRQGQAILIHAGIHVYRWNAVPFRDIHKKQGQAILIHAYTKLTAGQFLHILCTSVDVMLCCFTLACRCAEQPSQLRLVLRVVVVLSAGGRPSFGEGSTQLPCCHISMPRMLCPSNKTLCICTSCYVGKSMSLSCSPLLQQDCRR